MSRISRTWASVNLASPLVAPRAWRPLRTLSASFSPRAPANRWSGLTQGGLSQPWQASCSAESGAPRAVSSENRCARTGRLFSAVKQPYPSLSRAPVHSQHGVVMPGITGPFLSTYFQNLCSGGVGFTPSAPVPTCFAYWHAREQCFRFLCGHGLPQFAHGGLGKGL